MKEMNLTVRANWKLMEEQEREEILRDEGGGGGQPCS